jgi:hypothetical protein
MVVAVDGHPLVPVVIATHMSQIVGRAVPVHRLPLLFCCRVAELLQPVLVLHNSSLPA